MRRGSYPHPPPGWVAELNSVRASVERSLRGHKPGGVVTEYTLPVQHMLIVMLLTGMRDLEQGIVPWAEAEIPEPIYPTPADVKRILEILDSYVSVMSKAPGSR